MSFVSMNFAVFVLILLLLYYIVPKRYRYLILLAASYAFYAIACLKYIGYIIVTTILVFGTALLIEKSSSKAKLYIADNKDHLTKEEKKEIKAVAKNKQRLLLFLCLLLNLGTLLVLKYGDLAIVYYNYYRNIITGRTDIMNLPGFILPLGISFYTLQAAGYLIDVYYGKCAAEKNIFKFALFVSFFPQIVQGPIGRFTELSKTLYEGHDFDMHSIESGFYRILWGLFKKLVIADRLSSYVSTSMDLADYYPGIYVFLGVLAYGFQLYGDFSGGIDIAIGVAEMFGVKLTENFERPFFSKSIAEFWRRWHISLGDWFKDYVFYPLSINKTVLKLSKKVRARFEGLGKRLPIYIPMIFVWTLTGMWHGSGCKYVVWGLCNCFFIILGTEYEPLANKILDKLGTDENNFFVKCYRVVKTFLLMTFLRMFDLCSSPKMVLNRISLMFKGTGEFSLKVLNDSLNLPTRDLYIVLVAILILFIFELIERKGSVRERLFRLPVAARWLTMTVLLLVVVVFGYYGFGFDSAAFVYMQF